MRLLQYVMLLPNCYIGLERGLCAFMALSCGLGKDTLSACITYTRYQDKKIQLVMDGLWNEMKQTSSESSSDHDSACHELGIDNILSQALHAVSHLDYFADISRRLKVEKCTGVER